MRQDRRRRGFTLIELLVVMAIIAVLTAGVVSVGAYVRTNAKVNATKGTIQVLKASLAAWQEAVKNDASFQGNFPQNYPDAFVDGNRNLEDAILPYEPGFTIAWEDHGVYTWHDSGDIDVEGYDGKFIRDARARSEFINYFLMQEPESRRLLEGLGTESLVNADRDQYQIDLGGGNYRPVQPLYEVVDAWGKPIDYQPRGFGNFPRLVSAGPDGVFGNADDISSDEQ